MKALARRLSLSNNLLPMRGLYTFAFAVSILGLEVLGRRFSTTDIHDLLASMALVVLVTSLAVRHRQSPLPWLSKLGSWGQSILARLGGLKYEHGVDLRGTPPLPRKTPRIVGGVVLALVVWGFAAAGLWLVNPQGWRSVGVHTVYVLYLGLMLVLWSALLAFFFVGVFVPIAVLDRWLKSWLGETDRRGAIVAAVVGYAVLISLIAYTVPASAILVLCLLVVAGAIAVYLPRGSDGAAFLWRSRPEYPIYAVPLRRVLATAIGLMALLLFDVLLMACGGRVLGGAPESDAMPITAVLGAITAWTMPMLIAVGGFWLINAHRHDPARRTRPTVRIRGEVGPEEYRAATRAIAGWGWNSGKVDGREPGDVAIEIVPPERSEATEFDPRWPLRVSVADLQAGDVRSRIERREEIQLRRHFFRGLTKLFKRAAPFKGPGGGGLWLAPQWWFIEGLGREDTDSSVDDPSSAKLVGPPYHRVFPSRARQHIHQVLRGTQVDMIFIEDGVSARKVEKVLRVVLELFDVHGGKERAEEMHFRGLPKVRVMIHDYEPGNPFESDVYPEPKFDDLSRVRVLHIFRDRGGHEEHVEPPADFSWTPSPVGVLG